MIYTKIYAFNDDADFNLETYLLKLSATIKARLVEYTAESAAN